MSAPQSDDGYALLAAVAAIAVFATFSLAVIGQVQSAVLLARAEVERAHADTAVEAGAQIAIQNLIGADRAMRWSLDGRLRQLSVGGVQVAVKVTDQRGMVPLLALEEDQVRRLFELLDVPEDRLGIVTDSFLDWTDDDDDVRPNGAEFAYYSRRQLHPPNAAPQSFDELALVRGFDAALVKRLRAVATLHFGNGGFDPRHANPVAIALLTVGGENSPAMIDRQRELAGQRTAIELDEANTAGRIVEVSVSARTVGGGQSHLAQLVELTGNPARPYAIIATD